MLANIKINNVRRLRIDKLCLKRPVINYLKQELYLKQQGGAKNVRREKLSEAEISELLDTLEGWKFREDKIKKKFEFANFAEALAFVNKVGEIAERLDHHPDVKFGWGYAKIASTTHDRGGVTSFDIALAEKIDALAPQSVESKVEASDAVEREEESAGNGV